MKFIISLISIFIITSCNQNDSYKSEKKYLKDTLQSNIPGNITDSTDKDETAIKSDSIKSRNSDTLIMKISEEILKCLKIKNFTCLAAFIEAKSGIRFSPYAFIDTMEGQVLTIADLIKLVKSQKRISWGEYDAIEKPIKLSISKYFDKFVYSNDFLNAEKRSVNKSNGGGNSLDNLKKIYPDADYSEFYFLGFDPKYGGMDWVKLRLVFRTKHHKVYLIAIVHDEWTI